MVKLERLPAPEYLSAEKVKELTAEFKQKKTSVWNHAAIKDQLLASSYQKCAYCESRLDEESKFMEVEHFEDKDTYKDKVVEWANLLPSCKRCNGAKGTHDVIQEPIVNPYLHEPKAHLFLRAYRFRSKSQLGASTVDVLDLNNSARVVLRRFDIGEAIIRAVSVARDRHLQWVAKPSTRARNLLFGAVDGLLLECQRESEYSATAATILHDEPFYLELIRDMKVSGLWTLEFEMLHVKSAELVLHPE